MQKFLCREILQVQHAKNQLMFSHHNDKESLMLTSGLSTAILVFAGSVVSSARPLFAHADWTTRRTFACRVAATQEGLISQAVPHCRYLSAVSLTPFSFASIIEFAAVCFNLIAFCVTSKERKNSLESVDEP